MSFLPEYKTLDDLFHGKIFRIPHYQRFFSWQKKHIEDLFSDLENLKKGDENQHHFMATIMCLETYEKESDPVVDYDVLEIVDGQQRITTLTLILKAIEERIDDKKIKEAIHNIIVKGDGNLLLLQTNNINRDLFNNYLRNGHRPNIDEIKTHADKNFFNAIDVIEKQLDKWEAGGENLANIHKLIRRQTGFVLYKTDNKNSVYALFECLNSRGLEVDWLDKTKTTLMGLAVGKALTETAATIFISEIQDLWGKIYSELGRYNIRGEEIIRVVATLYLCEDVSRPINAEKSIEEFKNYCDTPEKALDISKWLLKITQKLVGLKKCKYYEAVSDIFQARILAVVIMMSDSIDDIQRKILLRQWENVTFRIYGMYGKDARKHLGEYIRLALNIFKKKDGYSTFEEIKKGLIDLGENFPIEKALDELLKEPVYKGFEEEIRYILWRYEEFLLKKENKQVCERLKAEIWDRHSASETIEHIYPQNPDINGPWKSKVKPLKNEKLENLKNSLGNLILLSPELNKEADNNSFYLKKKVYKKAEELMIIKEVIEINDWNRTSIKKREQNIADFLREEFADIE